MKKAYSNFWIVLKKQVFKKDLRINKVESLFKEITTTTTRNFPKVEEDINIQV